MHVRCPHCHNPIELVDDSEFSDIECPSCGSNFSLLVEETLTHAQAEPTQQHAEPESIAHFELLERVGVGAFGSVWKARDIKLDRTVAVKIPRKGQLDPTETEQFLREARAAAQLKHPNIVAVHEFGRDDGQVYIVSDFIDGLPLSSWLTARQPTPRAAVELCARVADALQHAHEAGVIHRDLKPANIMLDANDAPHIMDFGLAKREAGEITMTLDGNVLGTPAYMSPEQAKGEAHAADRRTDVYSLGVILFELLTGERPFRGDHHMLIHQVLHEEAPSPRKLKANLPRDLATICLKCLEKEPNKRFESATKVADELRRFLQGKPIEARPITQLHRTWRWCKRNPIVAGLGTTVGALTLSVAIAAPIVAIREASHRATAEAQEKETRRLLYSSDMKTAMYAFEEGNFQQMFTLLNRHWPRAQEPDLREFEWYYFWQLYQRSTTTRTLEHGANYVFSVAFSPDGAILASAGNNTDNTVKLWDPATGESLRTLEGASMQVAFSPDSTTLATGSAEHAVKLWDAVTGELLQKFEGHEKDIWGVAFSPDGQTLASSSEDQTIKLWNITTDRPPVTLEMNAGYVLSVAFSPDGKTLASGHQDGTLMLWDVANGTTKHTLEGHAGGVWAIAFSPDGTTLAAGCDDVVKLWDVAKGRELAALKVEQDESSDDVRALAFSPDGRTLASGNTVFVHLWSISTEQGQIQAELQETLKGHAVLVRSAAFSPDASTLATAAWDGTVKLWNVASDRSRDVLKGHKNLVWSVAFSPDGRKVASGSWDNTVKLWDVASGKEVATLEGHTDFVQRLAFSPDGKILASPSTDGTVKIWDVATARELTTLAHSARVGSAAFSPQAKLLATSSSRAIKLWDTTTWEQVDSIPGARGPVAFSLDGKLLAAVGSQHAIKLRELPGLTEQATLVGHTHRVSAIAFSPDRKTLASASWDRTVRLWDVATGKQRVLAHARALWSVAFSPDGNTLASGGGDHAITLWDVTTATERATLRGHTSIINSVAFSPDDGKILASAAADHTVRLWRAATKEEVRAAASRR